MNKGAQLTLAHMTRFERPLPAPPDKVWPVLTDTNRLPGWYGEGLLEPRVGGAVNFMGGHIKGVVTQWVPQKKLAYTWNVFMPGQTVSDYPESYLTLDLDDAKLTLTHLPVLEAFVKLNAMGWHTYLDMVAAAAHGETVQSRDTYMAKNAKRYGIDLANPLA
jgi:uncharacterized protein YndB with AHSA1/START domain